MQVNEYFIKTCHSYTWPSGLVCKSLMQIITVAAVLFVITMSSYKMHFLHEHAE